LDDTKRRREGDSDLKGLRGKRMSGGPETIMGDIHSRGGGSKDYK